MPPAARPLSIGALVRALAEEFPELTISKVRFLETEGLVTPARTASGYRQYSAADVERLRWVLRAQRDRFWPLTMIRAALEAADRGLEPGLPGQRPTVPATPPDGDVPDLGDLLARDRLRITATELAEAAGLSEGDVADLVEHGLLRRRADGSFGEDGLRAARSAAGLARYGVQARHLRVVRTAADREVGLVEQATGSLRGADGERARAEVLQLCLALHAALVRDGVDPRP